MIRRQRVSDGQFRAERKFHQAIHVFTILPRLGDWITVSGSTVDFINEKFHGVFKRQLFEAEGRLSVS
jgi:hypothetical protein